MEIRDIHPLNISMEEFGYFQEHLSKNILLKNTMNEKEIKFCAGVDVAYWEVEGIEWGVCSMIVIDYETKEIVEKSYYTEIVASPYVPGYLALRELPLIIKAAKKLTCTPDLLMFDGNGYLHPRHMGIATHASFFLDKPTIGIAKSYYKIRNIDFMMPMNKVGAYKDIIVGNEINGRVLRTQKNVKPIFISCGNYIDLETTTEITLNLINNESRLPIPVRLADLETKSLKRKMSRPK